MNVSSEWQNGFVFAHTLSVMHTVWAVWNRAALFALSDSSADLLDQGLDYP